TMVPSGRISLTALWPLSATKTWPAASTATPYGWKKPEPRVTMVPPGSTFLTALLSVSATKTSPAASTATPVGLRKPEPRGGATGRGKAGSVEYWNRAVAVAPSGLTAPFSVAPVAVTTVAAAVEAAGGSTVRNDRACAATVPWGLAATRR